MRLPSTDLSSQQENENGDRRCLNSELWHACAGPLVSLPAVGGRVVYFPQGHSEQVTNSTNRQVDAQIPNYPSLPPQLVCQLHDLTMHADAETDEVYAQMTLQPLSPQEQKEIYLPAQFGIPCKQPTNYFCKTLTASDTSTHGGFSVPRRAAEKVFPPLDFSLQPPAQELIARDLHDNEWKFRHIFRGQPKRHLLTTGWSVFVSAKRLVAGDSVLFIWNETNQLFIGIRRASRSQTVLPSSVLSSDSMHLGLLAAAAHAASTNSRFTIFYNPRTSPTEFVIPLAKYVKAVYHTRVSIGMRFRMMVETEESNVRRYMGTITGICDLEPARWPNSHWQSVKVGWDESTAGERQPRVSLWEIEPLTTFPMYPSPFSLGMKRPWQSGTRDNMGMNRLTWFQGDSMEYGMYSLNLQGVGLAPYMQPRLDFSMLSFPNDIYQVMAAAALQDMRSVNPSSQASSPLLHFQQPQAVPASTSFAQAPVFPESQPQQSFIQNAQSSQPQFQQQLQHSVMLKREPSELIHQQHHMEDQHQQIPNLVSLMPQQVSDLTENPASSAVATSLSQAGFCSPLENVTKNDPLVSSAAWLYKRAPVEPPLPNMELVNPLLVSKSEDTYQLPPFPAFDPDETTGVQNNIMFGVNNIDSSSLLMPSRLRIGENGNLPFLSTDIIGNSPSDYANQCTNSSELLHFPDNTDTEPPTRNFVKVCKSGSFGRSLDLAKFSSYEELRNELGRLFGLEGQLEDPQRSGWQLVFVDKENDILLLGDDPWMEFVNSVWCIQILSVKEVQQMDPQGMELLGSVPTQKLSNWVCEDRKNMISGIPWLEY